MPIDGCAICDDINCIPRLDNYLVPTYTIRLLCQIAENTAGGITPADSLVFDEFGSLAALAAASVPAAYGSIGTVPEGAYTVTFYNATNQPIFISSDGIADGPYLPAGGSYVINALIEAGGKEFFAKYASGAPTTGDLRTWYATHA